MNGDKQTLQFPLPLLAFGKSYQERLSAAINYAVVTTGFYLQKKFAADGTLAMKLKELKLQRSKQSWFPQDHLQALALGDDYCGVTHTGSKYALDSFEAVESFIRNWKGKGLTAPWTRVPKKMVFEARDGTAANYLRFSALCAVNAAIGSKPFHVVTRNRIRAGMLGYTGGTLLFDDDGNLKPEGAALLATREDGIHAPVTCSQVRTLLDNLVKASLLQRFTPYRGSITYYSKFLPPELIAKALLEREAKKATNPKLAALGEALRKAKQGNPLLSGDQSETSPHNRTSPHNSETATQSPPDSHPVATRSPHNASSYAALNASLNASPNASDAGASSCLKNEEAERKKAEAKPHFEALHKAVDEAPAP